MKYIDVLIAQTIHTVLYLIGSLPYGLSIRISNTFGNLWYTLDKRHREVALSNLELALGKEVDRQVIEELARENFRQMSRLLFEVGWSLRLKTSDDVRRYVRLEGLDHVNRAFRQGKGVLFLTGHLGSWELLTLVPSLITHTVHDIYRPLEFRPLEKVVVDFRTRFGMKLIAKKGAIRLIFKALARGEGVGIPLDQSVGAHDGVFADFFGRPTCTSKGMGLIALRTKVPVIPVFLVRERNMFKVIFGPRIVYSESGHPEKDLLAVTTAFNKVIEAMVRRYPEQWFWVHNRWKTQMPSSL